MGLIGITPSSFLQNLLCGPFLKSLLNLLQYCFCLMFWFQGLQGMCDLSSWIRDQTYTLCIRRCSLNNWTTREVPPLESQHLFHQFLLPLSCHISSLGNHPFPVQFIHSRNQCFCKSAPYGPAHFKLCPCSWCISQEVPLLCSLLQHLGLGFLFLKWMIFILYLYPSFTSPSFTVS